MVNESPVVISEASRRALLVTKFPLPFDPIAMELESVLQTKAAEAPFSPKIVHVHRPVEGMLHWQEAIKRMPGIDELPGLWHLQFFRLNFLLKPDWSKFSLFTLGHMWRDSSGNLYAPCLDAPGGCWELGPRLINEGLHPNSRLLVLEPFN